MTSNRWHMNRAGLFNFWYYDDEVFHLSGGRIIFRGANGAGKSVTMQSFLPLVLDGDKRPSRLDPFGSKDRRIEYYLLGDVNSNQNDRTGYIWMEFLQPETEKTLTIGIGLRARRGAAQVGFWGFALTDQRRIGHDFFLYDKDLFDKQGQRVPLDRVGLEKAIGAGGHVVREQGEYRELVNRLLFGFDDEQAYRDLLWLMIQLRSPKLSKDFRPSTIYEILHSALPPLGDEDLRPLAEVLEDLDEISNRLDELQLHVDALGRLDAVYTQYNEQRMYDLAKQVLDASSAHAEKEAEMRRKAEALQQLQQECQRLRAEAEQADEAMLRIEQEISMVENSQGMAVQRELDTAQAELGHLVEDTKHLAQRVAEDERRESEKRQKASDIERDIDAYRMVQMESSKDMERLADIAEYRSHEAYAGLWLNPPERDEAAAWTSWQQDVSAYIGRLRGVHKLCGEVRAAHDKMADAERELSEARQRRDEMERGWQEAARELESCIRQHEDALLAWRRGLTLLPLSDEAWREMVHRLQDYPDCAYDVVVEPVKHSFEAARDGVRKRQLAVEHQREQWKLEAARLEAELEEWRQHREPEPPRSEAKAATRRRRLEQFGDAAGAPLYRACEFQDHVDEHTRAVLETALYEAGLLDAWIHPKGAVFEAGDEETFITPNPALFGYTLADYLRPTPPEDSGLTATQIDDVLRTIRIGESEPGVAYVSDSGQFSMGPLVGQVATKDHAEWIGYEARKRARKAEIERLEAAIQDVKAQIQACMDAMSELNAELVQLQRERDTLPDDKRLREAATRVQRAEKDLEHAETVVLRCSDKYKALHQTWAALQAKLHEQTSTWERLRKEEDFAEALEAMAGYQSRGRGIEADRRVWRRLLDERIALLDEVNALAERIGQDRTALGEREQRQRNLKHQIASLRTWLEEQGLLDIFERLSDLKRQREEWKKVAKRSQEQYATAQRNLGQLEGQYASEQQATADALQWLNERVSAFAGEWNVRLVTFDEGARLPNQTVSADASVIIPVAQMVQRVLRGRYEGRKTAPEPLADKLRDVFWKENATLLDYALELRHDAALGRYFIESLRDRSHPRSPRVLYEELKQSVEEQQALIQEKDRELYEQILIRSVGRAIRDKIHRAEEWVSEINRFMEARKTSSGFVLSLTWKPRPSKSERELDTERLVHLLRKSPDTLRMEEMEQMMEHFRSRVALAKEEAENRESLRYWIQELLDYRSWFDFTLHFRKGQQPKRELTDSQFNVLSGGEKAMAMYIPLFAATDSRYKNSRPTAPRMISLDEAFAGVDDENMRDMFQLLTDMQFDYMMTSQSLWGCYDTVPSLSIYEIHRPQDSDVITLIPYYWNGHKRRMVVDGDWQAAHEAAPTEERDGP